MELNPRAILVGRQLLDAPLRLGAIELPVLAPDRPDAGMREYRKFETDWLRAIVNGRATGQTSVIAVAGLPGSGKSTAIRGVLGPNVVEYRKHAGLSGNKVNIVELPLVDDAAPTILSALNRNNINDCEDLVFFYPQPLGHAQVLRLSRPRSGLFETVIGGASYVFPRRPVRRGQLEPVSGRQIDQQVEPLLYAMYYFDLRHPSDMAGPERFVRVDEVQTAEAALDWTRQLIEYLGWSESDIIRLLKVLVDYDASTARKQTLGIEMGFRSVADCVNTLRVLLLHFSFESPDILKNPERVSNSIRDSGAGKRDSEFNLTRLFTRFGITQETLVDNPESMEIFLRMAAAGLYSLGENKNLVEHLLKPLGQ